MPSEFNKGESRLSKGDYFRRGPDYLQGQHCGFIDIKKQFGFKSLSIGRWVSDEEKLSAATLVFNALADLSLILNVPAFTLGLREHLSLAFGTGGRLGVQAHYEVPSRTLALAKNAGAGALAHEWWHAFDHYVANKMYSPKGCKRLFASEHWVAGAAIIPHSFNRALGDVFLHVLAGDDSEGKSDYVKRSEALDKAGGVYYFSQPTELMARAFEAWVQSREDIKNHYLVSGTKASDLAKQGGYPTPQEIHRYAPHIENYFTQLGAALMAE